MEKLLRLCLSSTLLLVYLSSSGQNVIKDKAYFLKKAFTSYQQTSEEFRICIDSALIFFPDDAQLWREKATSHFKAGQYAPAMKYIDKAVELDTLAWLGYRGFMKCIFMKDYENALTDLQAIYKIKPLEHKMDHSYPFWIGLCYLKLEMLDSAKIFFNISINESLKNGKDWVHFNERFYLGICYYKQKKYTEALKEFDETLRLNSDFPDAQYYKAQILLIQKKKKEGLILLKTAKENAEKGKTINEDNEAYVNYPFQIKPHDIKEVIEAIEK